MRNRLLDLLDAEKPVDSDERWHGRASSEIFFRVSPGYTGTEQLIGYNDYQRGLVALESLYLGSSMENIFILSQEFNRQPRLQGES